MVLLLELCIRRFSKPLEESCGPRKAGDEQGRRPNRQAGHSVPPGVTIGSRPANSAFTIARTPTVASLLNSLRSIASLDSGVRGLCISTAEQPHFSIRICADSFRARPRQRNGRVGLMPGSPDLLALISRRRRGGGLVFDGATLRWRQRKRVG